MNSIYGNAFDMENLTFYLILHKARFIQSDVWSGWIYKDNVWNKQHGASVISFPGGSVASISMRFTMTYQACGWYFPQVGTCSAQVRFAPGDGSTHKCANNMKQTALLMILNLTNCSHGLRDFQLIQLDLTVLYIVTFLYYSLGFQITMILTMIWAGFGSPIQRWDLIQLMVFDMECVEVFNACKIHIV